MVGSKALVPSRQTYLDLKPDCLYIVLAQSDHGERYMWAFCWSEKPGFSIMMYVAAKDQGDALDYFSHAHHKVATDDFIISALQIGEVDPDMFQIMNERLGQLPRTDFSAEDGKISSKSWVMAAIKMLDDQGFIQLLLPSSEVPDPLKALQEEAMALGDECVGLGLIGGERSRKLKRSKVAMLK